MLLLLAEAFVFYEVWLHFYNPNFRNPYVFKGNVFAACVYSVLMLLMKRFYGGLKLGYHRSFNIIFGLSMTAILTNIAAYFIIILQAATWFLSPIPAVFYMSLIDIAIVIVWGLIFNRLFRRIFPPNKLVLIAGTGADELKAKFAQRSDRYHIADTIIIPGSTICEVYGHKALHRTPAAVLMKDENDEHTVKKSSEVILRKKFFDGLEAYDGVVVGDLTAELRNDILKNCYSRGIRTYSLPKITDVILKSSETMAVFDSPLFLNRNSGLSIEQALVKRISDIIMSLIGLIITSPFMIVIAIAIKAEDGGPVFFKQRRCTEGGREFDIIKFRSMIVNAEQSGISVPATKKDPRITKVGAIIRATRLDELPQLINILRGDMSVVGPRPERIEHVREYCEDIPEFKYRMSVKGGLTGYAQVYGKYNTSAYDKLKLDLLYIQNYSLMLDMEIILKTVQVLFTKESTEGFDKEKSESISEASRRQNENKA
ncbi:MAG: sugar transferase [Lachnospiraceae bacterium]|nr:sugar transferase [Lachnospiraceae bacterium]